jgi:hypothetical protein
MSLGLSQNQKKPGGTGVLTCAVLKPEVGGMRFAFPPYTSPAISGDPRGLPKNFSGQKKVTEFKK